MKSGRFWERGPFHGLVLACGIAAMLALAPAALANSGGRSGASGKSGRTCSSCHQGGPSAPTVTLDGPRALDAGASATYTLRVETSAKLTGMGAAASEDDAVLTGDPDGGTQVQAGEITHLKPITTPDAGVTIYAFSMQAPPFGGRLRLFAAGNACDGDGQTSGDEAAATTLDVDIDGPPRPPEPEAGPFVRRDAGPTDASADDAAAAGGGTGDPGGCAVTARDRSSGSLALATLAFCALLRRTRRNRS